MEVSKIKILIFPTGFLIFTTSIQACPYEKLPFDLKVAEKFSNGI